MAACMRAISHVSPWMPLASTNPIAQLAGAPPSRSKRQPVAADDGIAHLSKTGVAGLGSLGNFAGRAALQPFAHRSRHALADAVPVKRLESAGEGRSVGCGGSGADHAGVVPNHIREQQRLHRGGHGHARQLPALDP